MAINLVATIGMNNELNTFDNHLCKIDSLDFIDSIKNKKNNWLLIDKKTMESFSSVLRDNCFVYGDKILENFWDVICYDNIDSIDKKFGYSDDELWVFGTGKLYSDFMPIAYRMYLNEVQEMYRRSRAYYPYINENEWYKTILEEQTKDGIIYHKTRYVRRRAKYDR